MKQTWSKDWLSSKQPRKQRKYRANAPLHIRRKFISAHLSEDLRRQFSRRAFPLRKGDQVEIMRGSFRGKKGQVTRVNLSKSKVYVEGVNVKKVDGSEVARGIQPSNIRIISLNLDDKKRRIAVDRTRDQKKSVKETVKEVKTEKETKPVAKPDKSKVPAKEAKTTPKKLTKEGK